MLTQDRDIPLTVEGHNVLGWGLFSGARRRSH